MSNRRYLTYEEYGSYINKLHTLLLKNNIKNKVDYIYGIPRGGLPIAVHLSHNLQIKMIDECEFYSPAKILLIDDLVDDGKTLNKRIKQHTNLLNGIEFITATLFYKPHSIIKPDFYIEETKDSIVFPWEDRLLEMCARTEKYSGKKNE